MANEGLVNCKKCGKTIKAEIPENTADLISAIDGVMKVRVICD